ncbi:MAG TPA: hypothetical protein P5274_02900 [Candidatus Paceibacterota bacterium]|nr:hypothetical protein [Candidatus Paceibacterota bacterium]
MVYYILAVLSLVSFIGMAFILIGRVRHNRELEIDYRSLGNYGVTGLFVDYLAFKIVHFFRGVLFKTYLFSAHFIKNCISVTRYLIVKIERRFKLAVANIPRPDEVHKTDKISFFLKEIKDHKETVMAELKSEAEEEIEK